MSNKIVLSNAQQQFLSFIAKKCKLPVGQLSAPANRIRVLRQIARWSIVNAVRTREGGKVYKPTVDDDKKRIFRQTWQEFLHGAAIFYCYPVSEKEHISRIASMCCLLGANHGHILHGGNMRFGVTQMGLNVYLKYLWCLGKIPPPPHCPASTYTWAKSDDENDYVKCIDEYKKWAKQHQPTQDALRNGIISNKDVISVWGLFNEQGI